MRMSESRGRRENLVLISTLVVAVGLAVAPDLSAHGDPPAGQQIYEVDGQWVYVTNFGVMTQQWPDRYVCEEAFFASQDFRVAPMAPDRWVTFSRSMIAVTEDGCSFEPVTDLPRAPSDIATNAESDEVAYIVRDDGETTIEYSADGGDHWQRVDVELDDVVPEGLGFAESGSLVVVGYEADDETRGEAVVTVIDVDEHERSDRQLDPALTYPELLDARDGSVLWHAGDDGEQRALFWSDEQQPDANRFDVAAWPRSGAIAPDGQTAFVGGIGDEGGIHRADAADRSDWTEIVGEHRALCMTVRHQGELLVCGHRDDDGHDLGELTADGQLEDLLDFRHLKGYRNDCEEGSHTTGSCPGVWPELATALDIDVPEPERGDENGCHSPSGPAAPVWVTAAVLLVVAVARRCDEVWMKVKKFHFSGMASP